MFLHPVAPQKQTSLVDEHFEPVLQDALSLSDGDVSSASEDDGKLDKKSRGPRLYEVKDERHAQALFDNVSLAKEAALPLGERVAALPEEQLSSRVPKGVKMGPGGSREISFVSRSKAKYQEDEDDKDSRRSKRGVQLLGPKPTNYEKRSRGERGRGGRGRG